MFLLHLLSANLGIVDQAPSVAFTCEGKQGKISQSSQSVAAVLQSARTQGEKHTHQFLNVSRDPLEIIYCVCCRL